LSPRLVIGTNAIVADGSSIIGDDGKDFPLLRFGGRIFEFECFSVSGRANIRAVKRVYLLRERSRRILFCPTWREGKKVVDIPKLRKVIALLAHLLCSIVQSIEKLL